MAFGNTNRQFGPNTDFYSFEIKSKDLPTPIFKVRKKTGDDYKDLPETAKRVSGNIIDARLKKGEHQGKEIHSLSLTMEDHNDETNRDEVYFVSVGETFLGRNIYNSLLNLATFDDIEIGLYTSKPKPPHTKGFASAATRQGGELVYGKYKNEQLPATKKVRVNGADQTDTEDLDKFFRAELDGFCKAVRAAAAKRPKKKVTQTHDEPAPEPQDDAPPAEEQVDDPTTTEKIPF